MSQLNQGLIETQPLLAFSLLHYFHVIRTKHDKILESLQLENVTFFLLKVVNTINCKVFQRSDTIP